jgi:hypothetical protein
MAAIVTDQFRILNANNFVENIESSSNSYYVFLGLSNPTQVGFGRTSDWNTNTPNPVDNFNNINHVSDTMIFGKKVTSVNVRRLVRRIDWTQGTRYEMYRHDYSVTSPSPVTQSSRLYDANYYVMNSNYNVYICIDNGSSGISTTGNASQDEPLFTDLEPSRAGESGDGYIWKYLFTVSPSDIIKFDSTEYISVRSGGKVVIDVVSGKITSASVSSGGKNYTYGMVDLGSINANATGNFAKLIPIIPPSKGHGYDLYKELGTDKVLIYARFDDSTKDFPTDAKFAQIGILKNPTSIGSTSVFNESQFSSLYSIKFSSVSGTISVGDKISQAVTGGSAHGYVASYDSETRVLKYYRDRSLYFNQTTLDQTDYVGVSTSSKVLSFQSSANPVTTSGGFSGSIDTGFTGITTNPTGNKIISLGSQFTNGLSNPEINKGSGEIIYLDNRPLITRNSRQKEDVKIILEF